jgi:hypothetical protein
MAIKLTKRKGFNFFRSYYDVYNELETDSDKVAFIDALLDRQFLGIKPTNLKGMAKFAYISQTNSIDSQVKGYEDKTGIILDPTQGGSVGGMVTPTEQEKEKEKEKEKVKEENNIVFFDAEIIEFSFDDFWSLYPNKTNKKKAQEKFSKLTKEQKQKIEFHLPYFINNKPFKDYNHPHAITYLNQERYNDEIQITNINLIPSQNELNDISKQVRLNNSKL